jgi:DnaJ family protein C protein 28
MDFQRVVEEQLRKAREEGKFDNLRGHGQPLRLDENPFEDPTWQMANEMLKKNGFRPVWLEEDMANQRELEQARRDLVRSREWHSTALQALGDRRDAAAIERRVMAQREWQLAQDRFRARLAAINKSIFNYNLKVPSTRLQRLKLDIEAELTRLSAGA